MSSMYNTGMSGVKKDNLFKIRIRKLCVMLLLFSFIGTILFMTNLSESDILINPVRKLPITAETYIFAITPTYARPVQKPELTRYVSRSLNV